MGDTTKFTAVNFSLEFFAKTWLKMKNVIIVQNVSKFTNLKKKMHKQRSDLQSDFPLPNSELCVGLIFTKAKSLV